MLNRQKNKTGVAILGRPQKTLETDPEFQGKDRADALVSGEQLASACLAAESLVLKFAEVIDIRKYIGRGQHPKCKLQPISVSTTLRNNSYAHPSLEFGSTLISFASLNLEGRQTNCFAIDQLIKNIGSHIYPKVSVEEDNFAPNVCNLHLYRDIFICQRGSWFSIVISTASKEFREMLIKDLSCRGTQMFSCIAAEEKKFLTVDLSALNRGVDSNPNNFIHAQVKTWASHWLPEGNKSDSIALLLWHLRQHIIDDTDIETPYFDNDKLDKAIKCYYKESLGSDAFLPSELKSFRKLLRLVLLLQLIIHCKMLFYLIRCSSIFFPFWESRAEEFVQYARHLCYGGCCADPPKLWLHGKVQAKKTLRWLPKVARHWLLRF